MKSLEKALGMHFVYTFMIKEARASWVLTKCKLVM